MKQVPCYAVLTRNSGLSTEMPGLYKSGGVRTGRVTVNREEHRETSLGDDSKTQFRVCVCCPVNMALRGLGYVLY